MDRAMFGAQRCGDGWSLIASDVEMPGASLKHASFLYAGLPRADISGGTLVRVNIFDSCFEGTSFARSRFQVFARSTGFERCDFRGADLTGSTFDKCNLDGADFGSATLTGVDLTKSTIAGARFDDAITDGLVFSADQLAGCPSLLERLLRIHIDAHGGLRAVLASGPVVAPDFELTVCQLAIGP